MCNVTPIANKKRKKGSFFQTQKHRCVISPTFYLISLFSFSFCLSLVSFSIFLSLSLPSSFFLSFFLSYSPCSKKPQTISKGVSGCVNCVHTQREKGIKLERLKGGRNEKRIKNSKKRETYFRVIFL